MLQGPRRYYFEPEFKSYIESYPWNGNLRELQIFAGILSLAGESRLTKKLAESILSKKKEENFLLNEIHYQIIDELGLISFMEKIEKEILARYTSKSSNFTQASISLKIPHSTFRDKWKKYELETRN